MTFQIIKILLMVTHCFQFSGASDLSAYRADLSSSGQGALTGEPLNLKKMKGATKVIAKIDVPVSDPLFLRVICPEGRVSSLNKYNPTNPLSWALCEAMPC